MTSCGGLLVVHRDGTVAYCSETLAGRECGGEDRPHQGGVFACRLVEGEACAYCNPVAATATATATPSAH
jgi:hypothetical protein